MSTEDQSAPAPTTAMMADTPVVKSHSSQLTLDLNNELNQLYRQRSKFEKQRIDCDAAITTLTARIREIENRLEGVELGQKIAHEQQIKAAAELQARERARNQKPGEPVAVPTEVTPKPDKEG